MVLLRQAVLRLRVAPLLQVVLQAALLPQAVLRVVPLVVLLPQVVPQVVPRLQVVPQVGPLLSARNVKL